MLVKEATEHEKAGGAGRRCAMDAESYVRALYRVVLGREADREGLRHWTALMRDSADATAVLAGLLASDEHRARLRTQQVTASDSVVDALAETLDNRRITIVDVGAQNLSYEGHIYRPLCTPRIPHRVIGFEPLLDRMNERADAEGSGVEMLPYAVGDGSRRVLHINNEDATSSLYPLNQDLNARFEHLCGLRTLHHQSIETRRLDDVLPAEPVDFLKLDVQGAELLVLQGAERALGRTAVVHCEVEFSPIYLGQPLYPEVQSFLGSRGFALIDLLVSHRYSYVVPSGRGAPDRLLWADAVFFRDEADAPTLLVQAMVALLVYAKPTLAEHLLTRHDALAARTLAPLLR